MKSFFKAMIFLAFILMPSLGYCLSCWEAMIPEGRDYKVVLKEAGVDFTDYHNGIVIFPDALGVHMLNRAAFHLSLYYDLKFTIISQPSEDEELQDILDGDNLVLTVVELFSYLSLYPEKRHFVSIIDEVAQGLRGHDTKEWLENKLKNKD